jgi:hypothetical protein
LRDYVISEAVLNIGVNRTVASGVFMAIPHKGCAADAPEKESDRERVFARAVNFASEMVIAETTSKPI